MGFSRQEYWSGFPCPPLGDLPDSGIELASLALCHALQAVFITEPLGKPLLLDKIGLPCSWKLGEQVFVAEVC